MFASGHTSGRHACIVHAMDALKGAVVSSSLHGAKQMVQDMIRSKWSLLAKKLQVKWGRLTDDDVGRRDGHRDYLVDKLQERYGIAREKARVEVKEFERSLR